MGILKGCWTIGNSEKVWYYWEFWKDVGVLGFLKGYCTNGISEKLLELLGILEEYCTSGNSEKVLDYWEFWKGFVHIGNSGRVLYYWEFWKGIGLLGILEGYCTIGNSEKVLDYWEFWKCFGVFEINYFTACLKGCWQWQPHFKGN